MTRSKSEAGSKLGIVISLLVHGGALGLLLVAFSDAQPLPEQHEAVPVETITTSQFEEVMRGQKDLKEIVADAPPPADKVAETVDSQPETSKPVAEKDAAAPPPPAPPDPVKDETPPAPEPPPPPEPVALPPPEPAPPPPPPPPPERPVEAEAPPAVPLPPVQPAPPPAPMPPERVPDAETVAPVPPPKPQPPKPVKVAEPKPAPQPPPKPVEAKPPPKPVPVPKPVEARLPPKPKPEKPKPDQLAKLLEQPMDERPAHKAITHPKAAEAQPDQRQFDPTDISKLLSSDAPSQKVSTGHQVSKVKAAGSESGVSQKMAASLWDQLDGLLEDQYKQCWSYLGLDGPSKYVPQIKVLYGEDGGLKGEPVLINPPSDPAMRSLAESAVRAVRRCNPLRIPAQYAPYYDQWKGRVLRFDPVDMAG